MGGDRASHVSFCRGRADKAEVCARNGITHFVDDRLDVLGHLRGVVEHRYLLEIETPGFGPEQARALASVERVGSWEELARELLRSV